MSINWANFEADRENAAAGYRCEQCGCDPCECTDMPENDDEPETHEHRCQQCDVLLRATCDCANPNRLDWCSSLCREAFDL